MATWRASGVARGVFRRRRAGHRKNMSYALTFRGEIADSVRRTAREQLEAAAAQLEQGDEDPAAAVHGARKRLKKTRALVRLARPALPRASYREENRALRDRGRALSAARDAD